MRINLWKPVPAFVRITALVGLGLATSLLFLSEYPPEQPQADSVLRLVLAQLEDQRETLDLAIEFGYDPLIVQVVRQLSHRAFVEQGCDCPTWRFVRTERDLSHLMLSIIAVESRGNYRAVNPGGPAYGLTQLVMSTARQYDKNVTESQLLSIPRHLNIAMRHFVDLLEKYKGNHTLAVLAWNRGSGAVDRSIAIGENPENGYGHAVLKLAVLRNAK